MSIRPVDLPKLRNEITHLPEMTIGRAMVDGGKREATAARMSELYFVAEPMVDLAMSAKDSLPDFRVEREDLPSDAGLCYFAKPMWRYEYKGAESIVTGALWHRLGSGLLVAWLIDRDYFVHSGGMSSMEFARAHAPRLWPIESHRWDWEQEEGAVVAAWGRLFMKSVWLLMQQTLASVSTASYSRSDRRRLDRENIKPSPIRVITLRRAKSSCEPGESDREYHHQWIVRGHWRQQWYASRSVHRPIWIAPHLKGPEGAPLLGGEKVHVWKR